MLHLTNTLSGKQEALQSVEPGHVRLYVCGPTVYDVAHLGHARSAVVYDVLVRHLRATGKRVTYVRNITDIDDKILKRAAERGEAPRQLAERFAALYAEDMQRLGNLTPDEQPKVSDHLPHIIALIERLLRAGVAYQAEDDVYFDVQRYPAYGRLAKRPIAELQLGASGRTRDEEAARKRHAADFALWKGDASGDFAWPSPWGRGRPGWHIECSAMSMAYLGETFDIHGGGLDLLFPHHENEVAQSEAATGKPLATLWMHHGFVEVDKEKMSKSLGNFLNLGEVMQRYEPEAVRYALLTAQYRAPLAISIGDAPDASSPASLPLIEEAERRLETLYRTEQRLRALPVAAESAASTGSSGEAERARLAVLQGLSEALAQALDDDLNLPAALAAVAVFVHAANDACDAAVKRKRPLPGEVQAAAARGFDAIRQELGLLQHDAAAILQRIRDRRVAQRGLTPQQIDAKVAARTAARAAGDYAAADALRQELQQLGVELQDSAGVTSWTLPR